MTGFYAIGEVATGSVSESTTVGDTTAPTLSAASATTTGPTTATGGVTTNEAGGTLYGTATASATATATQVLAGISKAVTAAGAQSMSFTGLPAATLLYPHYVHVDAAGNVSAVVNGASFTTAAVGSTKATYIQETFESPAGIPWTNLANMRWYFFDQVWPAPLGAPVAQGAIETTDGVAVGLFDIAGLTSLAPGQIGTLAYSNTNGDPDQADLMSLFSPVYVR